MKKLLAIAVAAALVAPAAAMADTTLYGKLHASVGQIKDTQSIGGVSASATNTASESHASRFGIKGATALDNGMEATYGLEYGLDIDGDNSRALAARNTFVGLKGGFGEVRVGRHDTPAKLATAGLDNFVDGYADMGNVVLADNLRVDNAVAYINKFGPVGVAVAHSTGVGAVSVNGALKQALGGFPGPRTNVTAPFPGQDQASDGNTPDANDLMVNYSNGPWYAGLGHTAVQGQLKNTNLGLGWKAEAGHNVNLVLEKTDIAGTSNDISTVYLAGGYKIGNVKLKAGYGENKVSNVSGKYKQTTLGADYDLSKKTTAYFLLNEQKATDGLSTGLAAGDSDKSTQTAVGLVTEF